MLADDFDSKQTRRGLFPCQPVIESMDGEDGGLDCEYDLKSEAPNPKQFVWVIGILDFIFCFACWQAGVSYFS